MTRAYTYKSSESRQRVIDGSRRYRVGRPRTKETKEKIRQTLMGHSVSDKTRDALEGPKSLDARQKMREAALNRPPVSEDTKQKLRDLWQDPEYVQKQMRANSTRPNRLELDAARWLVSLGFDYVGDGQLIVAGKCPDFWDGGTRLIELYGDYWHRNDNPQDRIDLFKAEGYDCLVIWERELEEGWSTARDWVLRWIEKLPIEEEERELVTA